MGSSKKQTVGYEFPYDLQFGLCYAADALLEFRGGDATAWVGQVTTNSTVTVDAPHLWGGQDNGGEGGIVGEMDVLFGDADQEPHPYLIDNFGQTSALRGKVTVLLRDTIYGAYNPYPKSPAFKVRRVFAAWPDDEPWYPAAAKVPHVPQGGWSGHADPQYIGVAATATVPVGGYNEFTVAMAEQYDVPYEITGEVLFHWRSNESGLIYSKHEEGTDTDPQAVQRLIDRGWEPNTTALIRFWAVTGLHMCVYTLGPASRPPPAPEGYAWVETIGSPFSTSRGIVKLWYSSDFLRGHAGGVGINAAHMLYYSFVSPTMEGLPAASLDDIHWRRQAERLLGEGFGLCTEWVPGSESVEQFRQRICNVIGGFLSRSRRDGKWRLHLPRGVTDINALPVLTDDDVLEWREEPSVLEDAVNALQTRWFDPALKQARITPTEHSAAMIDAFGGVITQTADFPEIPEEGLALRVNSRELATRGTPLRRISPVCNRKVAFWEAGEYVRVQCPRRGIADMVMLLMRSDVGESPTSAVQLVLMEDIFTMPFTSHLRPQDPIDPNPPQIPLPAPAQLAFEAPYVELAATLPRGELDAVAAESGYLLYVAGRPASGSNFALATATDGETFEEYGGGDWCPTAIVVEPANYTRTTFTLSQASGLQGVAEGTPALWDGELCRVDALDLATMPPQVTLGRGCADTVPRTHPAGSRIWFYGDWAASDQREYVLGEMVFAKALTRTSRDKLALGDAPPAAVEMSGRQARPYAPARLRINGEVDPDYLFGELVVKTVARDRLIQADLLVDNEADSIGPEPGSTAVVRFFVGDELVHEATGFNVSYIPPTSGLVRVEVLSILGELESWQAHVREFAYTVAEADPWELQGGGVLQAQIGDTIYLMR